MRVEKSGLLNSFDIDDMEEIPSIEVLQYNVGRFIFFNFNFHSRFIFLLTFQIEVGLMHAVTFIVCLPISMCIGRYFAAILKINISHWCLRRFSLIEQSFVGDHTPVILCHGKKCLLHKNVHLFDLVPNTSLVGISGKGKLLKIWKRKM